MNFIKRILNTQQADGDKAAPLVSSYTGPKIAGKNIGDFIFENITRFFAFIILALVVVMVFEMTRQSMDSIKKFGWGFIISTDWDPVHDKFGALPFIFGTLFSSFLALIIALPLSVGIAIFLSEFCST